MELVTKAVLHLHSKFSKRPSRRVLQKVGCEGNSSKPRQIYRTLQEKGMDPITVTDQNA